MPKTAKHPGAAQVSLDIGGGCATVTYYRCIPASKYHFKGIPSSYYAALEVYIRFQNLTGAMCRTALVEMAEQGGTYKLRIPHQTDKKATIVFFARQDIQNPKRFLGFRCREIAQVIGLLRCRQQTFNEERTQTTQALLRAITFA